MTPEDRPAVRYEDLELRPLEEGEYELGGAWVHPATTRNTFRWRDYLRPRRWHNDGDECTGRYCGNPSHFEERPTPRWPLLVGVLIVILGVVVIVQLASTARPKSSEMLRVPAQSGSGSSAVSLLLGAPSKGSPFEDIGAPQARLSGWATWYDAPPGTAAAGPLLRTGDWRGRAVTVCAGECITVRLTDWCACGSRSGRPTLIDLSRQDFARLASPSQGVVLVTVGRATLPATDRD